MMSSQKVSVLVVLFLVVGAVAGFYVGQQKGFESGLDEGFGKAKGEFQTMLDLAFPPPPAEIYNLTGEVQVVSGVVIRMLVSDPDDYLPHTDGTPRRTELRLAETNSKTEFKSINHTKFDSSGSPLEASFNLNDLREGEVITVRSSLNIKDAERFGSVIVVERVIY